jgi:hypothetical protein
MKRTFKTVASHSYGRTKSQRSLQLRRTTNHPLVEHHQFVSGNRILD